MQNRPTRRGGKEASIEISGRGAGTRLIVALSLFSAMMFGGLAGCVQAEKARYVRHLTTVVEPSTGMPEEVIFTFDIDRKKLPQGAVAAGMEN